MMKLAALAGAAALALLPLGAVAAPADPTVGLFAQSAGVGNAFEIEEAKIMLEDGTDPMLQAFAARMLHDHRMAQQDLDAVGRRTGVTTAFVLDPVLQKKVDDIGLMDGAKLDQAYIADQVEAHAQAAATLQAYAASGSDPALRAYARRTLPAVLAHQRMLEAITGQPSPM